MPSARTASISTRRPRITGRAGREVAPQAVVDAARAGARGTISSAERLAERRRARHAEHLLGARVELDDQARSSIAITASKADAMIADFIASLSWICASELRWARNASADGLTSGRQNAGSRGTRAAADRRSRP